MNKVFRIVSFRNTIRVSRSGPMFCRSLAGPKVFANVISRLQKSPLARQIINKYATCLCSQADWVSSFFVTCLILYLDGAVTN